MKVDGACLCGHVQYEAEVDERLVGLCHCTDCQINSGCAMGWVAAVIDSRFELKRGALKFYIKTAESGRGRALGFCAECGTRIVATPVEGEQGVLSLRVGAIRQRAELKPRAHLWSRSAQPWVFDMQELPRLEKQR